MATTVGMPRAGISVESCIIGQWKKAPGDKVSVGEVLFDYETDKAAFECESTAEGTLLECFFQEGDEVPCLVAVCAIGEPGEDVSALRPGESGGGVELDAAITPAEPVIEAAPAIATSAPVISGAKAQGISPRARKMAEELGVNPELATPTGPRDRVIVRDVIQLAESGKIGEGFGGRTFGGPAASQAAIVPGGAEYTDEKFSKIRKTIAVGMLKSLTEMAQVTHHHSFDASAILAFRKDCKAGGESMDTAGITLNDMVLYAVSRTLLIHPDLNAHLLNGDTLRRFAGVHLGVAVDTPRGLMVPTIYNADQMTLAELSRQTKELAAMCQSGSISPDLLQGGTFTVSNLGTLGVEQFTPIVNPPQVAILGVAGMTTRVRAGADGGVVPYEAMGLSLTYDHRAVDGAPAAKFARDLCNNLAQFNLMLTR
ncbi:MAG: 2-oxo acid dehydrogenase subunit E2 [Oscillospiraceae bacterium]|nr:2-oxo acid dehydrogenase subunit E2 [Oscillospiraceae bacterium]